VSGARVAASSEDVVDLMRRDKGTSSLTEQHGDVSTCEWNEVSSMAVSTERKYTAHYISPSAFYRVGEIKLHP